jgi:GAF domain-containing protein
VVRLLSAASRSHACFVYLVEDGGSRLVLRAAPEPYAHLAGEVALDRGEGLAWWALEHREPAFIRDNAFADPRFKYVPELAEEQFQSLVSVPIVGRAGEAIGVVSLHSEAPREFTQEEVDDLVSSALLMAGAIENARLYEETRRRVRELEGLTRLGQTLAQAATLDDLLPAVATEARHVLAAGSCHVYILEPSGEELRLRASAPGGARAKETLTLAAAGPQLAGSAQRATVSAPLVAGEELLGLLVAEATSAADLARTVANQVAVAIERIQLIDRLTEKNLIKDFFGQLAAGAPTADLIARSNRLGCDLERPHLVLVAAPHSDRLVRGLASVAPGSLFDRREDSIRALLRIPQAGPVSLLSDLRRLRGDQEPPVNLGISNPCSGAASFRAGFEEARHALLGASILAGHPGVMAYDELGPYKYLLRMSLDSSARDSHRDAIGRLVEYDRERHTSLVPTLEEFLRRHGNISATSEALFVHPNTLRQRLERIASLTGIDLRRDDWLMVEIALKLVKLQAALGSMPPE